MKQTLENRILRYLEATADWKRKGEIEDVAHKAGYLAETLNRKLRKLAREGKIQADYYSGAKKQHLVKYASLKVEKPKILKVEVREVEGRMVAVIV